MIAALLSLSATDGTVIVAFLYLAAGFAVATALDRRGHPRSAAVSAVVAWPLLVPLLRDRPASAGHGPLGARIDRTLDALLDTLRDPAAGDVAWVGEVDGLRDALHRADERLALVDRLLAEEPTARDAVVTAQLDALRHARARAAAEIEALLAGVVQLRLQIGMLALAGNQAPVRDRLRELHHRASALDELARMQPEAQA